MSSYRSAFAKYLRDTLGVSVSLRAWTGKNRLPIYLKQAYDFDEFDLLGHHCLSMVDSGSDDVSPSTLRKHMEQLKEKFPGDVMYVRLQLASYLRKRLIEQKVPFVVPGNQLYLPEFGTDLREFYRQQRSTPKSLTPAAQLTFLYLLVNKNAAEPTVNGLAKALGYSKMTMSRVFSELENAGVREVTTIGRNRFFILEDNRQRVWQAVQQRLRSPVTKRLATEDARITQVGSRAGLTALSHYSMLSASDRPTIATTGNRWKQVSSTASAQIGQSFPLPSRRDVEVELWSYDPSLLAEGQFADRFSVYLSLRENNDERVQAALTEMMETVRW